MFSKESESSDSLKPDEADVRSAAKRNALFCSGAGFAFIGQEKLATFYYGISLIALSFCILYAFYPSSLYLRIFCGIALVSFSLEIFQWYTLLMNRTKPNSNNYYVTHFKLFTIVFWLFIILTIIILFIQFGALVMDGSEMSPTIEDGQKMIYHIDVEDELLKPGKVILFKNSKKSGWGEPHYVMMSRILASPGDKISIRYDQFIINGEPAAPIRNLTGYIEVLQIPSEPHFIIVPQDSYFVQDDKKIVDSQVLSWVLKENIIATKIWHFSSNKRFSVIE